MRTIPYGHQWIAEEDIKEAVKVLRSDWLTQGPKAKKFEDALCDYTGAKYAIVVSSGTAALHMACLAAGIKKGDEVITSPITFVASANCVLYCGGRPVFVDILKDTANISPEEIRKKINKRTKAIIPVHFAGHPCDLEVIYQIAKEYNLMVIEDACHALGSEYKVNEKWIKIGGCKHSAMAVFSFHPVKSITTGEGGAILTNRRDLYEKLLIFRNHGITKDSSKFKLPISKSFGSWCYEMQELGFNYRLTDIQCALGVSQLKKIAIFIKKRKKIIETYSRVFNNIEYFDLPRERNNERSSWHLYPIRLKDKYILKKKQIFDKLKEKGIYVQVHYIPVYSQPFYRQIGYDNEVCPMAEDFYRREISIPIFQSLKKKDVEYIINVILKVFREI